MEKFEILEDFESFKNIQFVKKHPEFKKTVIDLLLYDEDELFDFLSSKINDEIYVVNLMKYISGYVCKLNEENDEKEADTKTLLAAQLYYRCVDAINSINDKTSGIEQAKNVYSQTDNSKVETEVKTSNDLICDKKLLQKLHAEFDDKNIWESMDFDDFLDYMRVEPIGSIKLKCTKQNFAKWLCEHIEDVRNEELIPDIGKWYKKIRGVNVNYSTQKNIAIKKQR